MGWSIFISNRCMMYPTFLPSKFYLFDIYFILFTPKVWVPNNQSFSLRQCTISYQGFFFHPIYSFIDEQLTDAGSGEGSADKSEAGSGDEQGSGDYEPVRDQSPICLDQRINVSLQRDGDQIHVSYRAFRFRTTIQGPRDKKDSSSKWMIPKLFRGSSIWEGPIFGLKMHKCIKPSYPL